MMKRLFSLHWILAGLLLLSGLSACVEKPTPEGPDTEPTSTEKRTLIGVNYFAANCMSLYYLWADDLKSTLRSWLNQELETDPFNKVLSIRYKKNGQDYDRWTQVTDAFDEMESGVEGISTTYGCDIMLMRLDKTYICAVVTIVYKDSPAAKAGLKRGDIIIRINGKPMTNNDYYALATEEFLYSSSCSITLMDPATGNPGSPISMTAVKMYEDPVVCHSVFQVGGKKVGYLVYTSFTTRSIDALLGVCEQFKAAGVSELILDLRYNGGGYVIAEEALASMLAPEANVLAGDLFEQAVYNTALTEYYLKKDKDALKTFFQTKFTWEEGLSTNSCDTRSGHLDLDRIYAIIDSGTASASESLLVGLMPYMDIILIGQQTHGKFCTGIMYGAQDWYDDYKSEVGDWFGYRKDVKDWGLYLMIGRYADRDGNCPAMPDGLAPAIKVEDRPDLGYDFGDERDPMLRQALILAGRTDLHAAASTRAAAKAERTPEQVVKPAFGKRILDPDRIPGLQR